MQLLLQTIAEYWDTLGQLFCLRHQFISRAFDGVSAAVIIWALILFCVFLWIRDRPVLAFAT